MSTRKTRVSGSFSYSSIEVGAAVLLGLMRGADVRVMVQRPAFATFARNVASLAARANGSPLSRPVSQADQMLELLRKQVRPAPRAFLQKQIGWTRARTRNALHRLKERGDAENVGRGVASKWQVKQLPSVAILSERRAVGERAWLEGKEGSSAKKITSTGEKA